MRGSLVIVRWLNANRDSYSSITLGEKEKAQLPIVTAQKSSALFCYKLPRIISVAKGIRQKLTDVSFRLTLGSEGPEYLTQLHDDCAPEKGGPLRENLGGVRRVLRGQMGAAEMQSMSLSLLCFQKWGFF